MKCLKVGFVPIARVNFDIELAEKNALILRNNLISSGFDVVGEAELITNMDMAQSIAQTLAEEEFDLLLVFQATFADSTMISALASAMDKPIFLWAMPEEPTGGRLRLNSLCGINLAAHSLRLQGIRYDYIYAKIDDQQAMQEVRTIASAASVMRRLRSAKLGVVGEHPTGLDSCRLDAQELASKLGVRVVHIDLSTIFQKVRSVEFETVQPVRKYLDTRMSNLAELDQTPLYGTLGTYVVMKQIAQEQGLDGIAVRCWPEFFSDLGCAACGAISMLTDDGIPCSCEADANGTITQLVLNWLSDSPAFGTDIVSVDVEKNHFIIWHCGLAPLSLANPAFQSRGTIHSNRKLPLLMEFPLKPGKVTVARLSQSTGELRLVVGSGEMISAPSSFSGTSGVIVFERPAQDVLDTILREGLEHHVAVTYGSYAPALLKLVQMLDMPVLHL